MVTPTILRDVVELAKEVQRAKTIPALLGVVGVRLERLGFDLAVLASTRDQTWVQYLTDRPPLSAVAQALGLVKGDQTGDSPNPMLLPTPLMEGRMLLEDLPSAVAGWVGARGEGLEGIEGLKHRGLVAPLDLGERAWGGILFMHDELDASLGDWLTLFALQLGSAIELLDHAERLRRRDAELELVHQLAVAGPRTDTAAMCQRALALVCRTTHSEAGALYRLDASSGELELIGEVQGASVSTPESFRRLPAPERLPERPRYYAVDELPFGRAEAVAAGLSHLAVVPLLVEGTPEGLLVMGRRGSLRYAESELHLAEILGVQMTSLTERARLYDETRRLLRVSVEAYDELARAQAELVRHERLTALGELAAVMAHEVRNPLGVIFNSLNTLKRLFRPTGDSEMLLSMVEEEAERLNRIVADLLDFVRPYELAKKPLAIAPVVEAAVAEALHSLPSATAQVVTECEPELPLFPADADLLKQAIANLVVNAVQAMPKGGTVTVRSSLVARPEGAWLQVEVRDQGPGLSPRAAEKMFQPFFTTKATGTGLGLAVVKRIVESHQGEIVVSPNPEKGAAFTLRIPPASERDSVSPLLAGEATRRGG